jgi:hypothetical protein
MATFIGGISGTGEIKKAKRIALGEKINKLNDMKDKAFDKGDMKAYRKLDRMAVVAFDKWLRLKG